MENRQSSQVSVTTDINEMISVQRSGVLKSGIDALKALQLQEERNIKDEQDIAGAINRVCNCNREDKSLPLTVVTKIEAEFGSPIIKVPADYGNEMSLMLTELKLLGVVQGDSKTPLGKNSGENEWYLHLEPEEKYWQNTRSFSNNGKYTYYAPIKGLLNVAIAACK